MKGATARRSHTGVRLAIGLSAGTPLLLIGAPSVAADPATDGPAEGQYMVTISDGQNEVWTITPSCGQTAPDGHFVGYGCSEIKNSYSGWTEEARPPAWSFGPVAGSEICPDGTKTSVNEQTYSFNPVALTGTITVSRWIGCDKFGGLPASQMPPQRTFTMKKL
jgi:hypothetical protein